MNKETFVPKLSSNIDYHRFTDDSLFIHQKTYGHRIKISNDFYELLLKIDGVKTLKDISNSIQDKQYDVDFLYKIFFEKLGRYGIVEGSEIEIKRKEKPSYLKLSFIVIPEKAISRVTPYLKFLFKPVNIKIALTLAVTIITIGLYNNFDRVVNQNLDVIWLQLIVFGFLSVTFHEFGHVTAANYFGAKHGGIGGGFYLFSPVYFADVTDIWKLPPKQRIIVNLAGIYFELMVCSLFILIGTFTHYQFLSVIGILILINTLFNLNPFLRSDGYWILTDLLEIPNLYKKSSEALRKTTQFILKRNFEKPSKKNILLAIYALLNYMLIGVFLYYVLILDPLSILYFPVNLYDYISAILNGSTNLTLSSLFPFLLPLIFYYMVFKYAQVLIRRRKLKLRSKSNR